MLLQAVVLMLSRRPKSYCNRKDKRDVFYHSKNSSKAREATAKDFKHNCDAFRKKDA